MSDRRVAEPGAGSRQVLLIGRGLGRSDGDAAQKAGGTVLDLTPGTRYVTAACRAIAADIHGKNHHLEDSLDPGHPFSSDLSRRRAL